MENWVFNKYSVCEKYLFCLSHTHFLLKHKDLIFPKMLLFMYFDSNILSQYLTQGAVWVLPMSCLIYGPAVLSLLKCITCPYQEGGTQCNMGHL